MEQHVIRSEESREGATDMFTGAALKIAMKNAPLVTHQKSVSVPAVNRYIDKLSAGSVPPAIKVADGVIIEGNHRYVAGYVLGKVPPVVPYIDVRKNDPVFTFSEIDYDPADWGNA
jgi:hypothetical protein